MPQNITDVNAFTTPVTAPADGDTRNAASVLTTAQALSNRTYYLQQLVGGRNAANGFAGLNASSQVPAAQLPYGAASGIAQLDASSRLPAATVRNGVVDVQVFKRAATTWASTGPTATNVTNGGGWTDIGSLLTPSFTTECNNADVLEIEWAIYLSCTGASAADFQICVNDGGTVVQLGESYVRVQNGSFGVFPPGLQWVGRTRYALAHVGTGGTAFVKVQGQWVSGTSPMVIQPYDPSVIIARLIRP